jgi:murein DD-endopeptidase MepM/ murein hydrolase activator NlpD
VRQYLKLIREDDGRLKEPVRLGFWVTAVACFGIAALWAFARPAHLPIAGSLSIDAALKPVEGRTTTGAFTPGKMLFTVLKSAGVPAPQADGIARAFQPVLDPRSLNEADRYELLQTPDGKFQRLSIARRLERFVVEAAPTGWAVRREPVPLKSVEKSAAGTLADSLWVSMQAQGVAPAVIVGLADIFAWNIDFLTETRGGDRFALQWKEQRTPDGKIVDVKILGAIYDGEATGRHVAVRFMDDYYGEKGESLRKAFLHAPLNFRRISSGFTTRRFHPVFRIYRPHLGTDYAAPTGTPVVSVGDGTVVFRGKKGGFGNLVMVRHNGTYTSYYGHLSRFAKGLSVGSKVRQGQLIAYVGSTGISTGPHLHFQMMKNGSMVNFLTLKMPSLGSVPAARMKAYEQRRDNLVPALEKQLPPNA